MFVHELIEWLKTQPANATVYIHDADTQWYLRLRPGADEHQCGTHLDLPKDGVAVHGDYGDHA